MKKENFFRKLIDLICGLSYKSRKNGLLSLENKLPNKKSVND